LPRQGSSTGQVTRTVSAEPSPGLRPSRRNPPPVSHLGPAGRIRQSALGELAALRRADIDLDEGTVKVTRSLTELPGGGYHFGPTKSEAGQRSVAIPGVITSDLAGHLARFTMPGDDALVFTSPTGRPLHHSNFRRRIWSGHARLPGSLTSTFTIFAIPATPSPRRQAPTSVS
jgi:hypothetical protein